jgi:AcrR family transcriptional regulator
MADDEEPHPVVAAHPSQLAPEANRPRGRPRRVKTEADILTAASELLGAGGYAGVTFEKVAARAGVTRPTIYRRWATKAALIFAVLGARLPAAPELEGASLLGDLHEIHRHFAGIMADDAWREAMPGLIADLRVDPAAEAIFQEYWRGAVDAAISRAVSSAVVRGEIQSGPEVSLLGDLLLGPVFLRALMSPALLTDDFVDAVFAHVATSLQA